MRISSIFFVCTWYILGIAHTAHKNVFRRLAIFALVMLFHCFREMTVLHPEPLSLSPFRLIQRKRKAINFEF